MIATFYSYKGGVGRSMAMVNVAEILADRGHNVVLCDWDLEAPGLERYVVDDKDAAQALLDQPGIMDLLLEYKAMVSHPSGEPEGSPRDFEHVGELRLRRPSSYAKPIPTAQRRTGSLRLLSAGRRGGEHESRYADAVRGFNWTEFYEKWAGAAYLEFLRKDLVGGNRIVLIDSRTGVTEHSGVCTHHLPDLVVLLTAANDLNLDGVAWMARILSDEGLTTLRGGRPLQIMPIAARIEQGAQRDELNHFKRKLQKCFGQYLPSAVGDPIQFLRDTEIPYIPYYSFEERVAAREASGVRDEKLFDAYKHVAIAIERVFTASGLLTARDAPAVSPPADVRAAISAHQQWLTTGRVEGRRADFTGGSLPRADFVNAHLDDAIFEGANLRGASFSDGSFAGANFSKADLSIANLRAARLPRASLADSTLVGATLTGADLTGAQLTRADVDGSDFRGATLAHASLSGARMGQANLEGANLDGADLRDADLSEVIGLSSEQLVRVDCEGAKLPASAGGVHIGPVDEGMTGVAVASVILAAAAVAVVWVFATADSDNYFNNTNPFVTGALSSFSLNLREWLWASAGLLAVGFVAVRAAFAVMWRRAEHVPTIFADGRTVAQRAAPWLPARVQRALTGRTLGRPFQYDVSLAALWWFVPIATALLIIVYLPAEDTVGSALLATLVAAELGFSEWIVLRVGGRTARPGGPIVRRRSGWIWSGAVGVVLIVSSAAAIGVRSRPAAQIRFSEPLQRASFILGDRLVLLEGSHGKAALWNPDSGRLVWTAPAGLTLGAVSPDGRRALAFGGDSVVVLATDGADEPVVFHRGAEILGVSFGTSGNPVAIAKDGLVISWARTAEKFYRYPGFTPKDLSSLRSPRFSPGARAVSVLGDGRGFLLDLEAARGFVLGGVQRFFQVTAAGVVYQDATGLAEAKWFFAPCAPNTACFPQLDRSQLQIQRGIIDATADRRHPWSPVAGGPLVIDESGRLFAPSVSGIGSYFPAVSGAPFSAVGVSESGLLAATAGKDGRVRLFFGAEPLVRQIHVFRGHGSGTLSVAFSGDSRRVVSSDQDSTARIWRVPDKK